MGARLRLIELTAALSLATDAGTGQPFEHALRTCLLASRCGDALGLASAEKSNAVYTALLRFLGCTSDASETAVLAGGDEIAFNEAMAEVVMADDREAVPHLIRHLGQDLPLTRRIGRIASALSDPGGKARSLSSHCEVGARLATRIGLPRGVVNGVAHGYERWDGKGLPDGLAGEEIPLATRIAIVARDVDVIYASSGIDGVRRSSNTDVVAPTLPWSQMHSRPEAKPGSKRSPRSTRGTRCSTPNPHPSSKWADRSSMMC